MKIIFTSLLISLCLSFSLPQDDYMEEVKMWQNGMNKDFTDAEHSPLTEEARKDFKALDFFSISKNFRIEADFERVVNADTILFKTTTDRTPKYFAYGIAKFQYEGKEYQLTVYKNVRLMKLEEYKDYLFLPYTDASNGNGSYGGGRYIDPLMSQNGKIFLDFNKSYNPYCCYNKKYSCPIPPSHNDLDFEVKAGVKAWH